MAVSSFLSCAFRCSMTLLSPFMMIPSLCVVRPEQIVKAGRWNFARFEHRERALGLKFISTFDLGEDRFGRVQFEGLPATHTPSETFTVSCRKLTQFS